MSGPMQAPNIEYWPTTQPQGWTCGNCGSWVSVGTTHTCTYSWGQNSGWSPPIRLTDEEIDRIAKRVAELLDTKTKSGKGG